MAPPTRTPPRAWIDEGLRALGAGGPEAVAVEPIAKALGVTKGSFYGHFRNRDALLEAMLEIWEQTLVAEVIERVEADGGDARMRLRRLFALATDLPGPARVDLAIRDWARRNAAVASHLRRADDRRLAYLRSLFADLYEDEREVEARCLLVMTVWIGNQLTAVEHGRHGRGEILDVALNRVLS